MIFNFIGNASYRVGIERRRYFRLRFQIRQNAIQSFLYLKEQAERSQGGSAIERFGVSVFIMIRVYSSFYSIVPLATKLDVDS